MSNKSKDSKIKFTAYNLLRKGIKNHTSQDYDKAIKNMTSYVPSKISKKCICGVYNTHPYIVNHSLNGIQTNLCIGSVCIIRIYNDILITKKDDETLCKFWETLYKYVIKNDRSLILEARSVKRSKACCNKCEKSSTEKYFIIKGICKKCRKEQKEQKLNEIKEKKIFSKIANTLCILPKYYGVKIKDLPIPYIQFCIKNQTKQANDYIIYYDEYKKQKEKVERISNRNKKIHELYTPTKVSKKIYEYGE